MEDWLKIELLLESGKYDQAKLDARSSLATDPTNALVLGQLGRAELGLDQFSEALDSANRLTALQPDDYLGFWLRGSALLGLQQYAEATKAIRQTLALAPGNADAHCFLARTLIAQAGGLPRRLGQSLIDEAKREIDQARAIEPNSFIVHFSGAMWAIMTEDLPEAEREIRAALALDPNDAQANHLLGVVQEQSGDSHQASSSYLLAGKLDPSSNSAIEQLRAMAGGSWVPAMMVSIGIMWVVIAVAGIRSTPAAVAAGAVVLGFLLLHRQRRRTAIAPEARVVLDREEQLRRPKFPFS